MRKTKVNRSLTFEPGVLKAGTKYAKTIQRSLSWYVNELVKNDLIEKDLNIES